MLMFRNYVQLDREATIEKMGDENGKLSWKKLFLIKFY
jgi:hypothetical protein